MIEFKCFKTMSDSGNAEEELIEKINKWIKEETKKQFF